MDISGSYSIECKKIYTPLYKTDVINGIFEDNINK